MHDPALVVTEAKFTRASDQDERQGLLGFVAVTLNDALRLDCLTLRRSAHGDLYLSYPARTDRSGERHAVVRPLGDIPRRVLQDQVFERLGLGEAAQ